MKLIIDDFDVDNADGAYEEVHVNLYGPKQRDGSRTITTCKAVVERVLSDDTILTKRDPEVAPKVIIRLDPNRPKKDV